MGLSSWGKLFDPYERKARLFPGLLVVLPMGILVLSISGKLDPYLKLVASLLISCGAPFLLVNIARDAGKALEWKLFKKWGGMPTTQLLRHNDEYFDTNTKQRYHSLIQSASGIHMPDRQSELSNPRAADEAYRAAALWLITQTRDVKKFHHVFRENVAYGFRRNATGMRWIGLLVALSALAVTILIRILNTDINAGGVGALITGATVPQVLSLGCSVFLSLIWLFFFGEAALRRSAVCYADRLIRSCDELKRPRKARRTTPAEEPV
ncbi:hypothetical protein ACUS6C_04145 [Pseudomonas aeruginosa]